MKVHDSVLVIENERAEGSWYPKREGVVLALTDTAAKVRFGKLFPHDEWLPINGPYLKLQVITE